MAIIANKPLTIGKLAQEAGVGIETIRYYQRVHLLPPPEPAPPGKTFRHYPAEMVARLQFIKRAQNLGFSLEEIRALLLLNDGTERNKVRQLAASRLGNVRSKIADLQRIESTLVHLLHTCEHTDATHSCPIIAQFSGEIV